MCALSDLPIELMLLILELLPYTDIWRLRRISRAWNHLLQEKVVVQGALRRYETHDPADAAHTPATIEARVAVMRAHRSGTPTGVFRLPRLAWPVHEAVLKGKYLAYSHMSEVYVVDLSCGKTFHRFLRDWPQLTLTDTFLIIWTTRDLQYSPPNRLDALKSRPVHDLRAVAGCGQLIAVIQATELTVYNVGSAKIVFRTQLGVYDLLSMAMDSKMCYITGLRHEELALTTIDYRTGMASCRTFKIDPYWESVSIRPDSGLHIDCVRPSRHLHMVLGKRLAWTEAGAYWKGHFYHDWLHEGSAIAVHKGLRRSGLVPCVERSRPLVNESFLVDVANMMVYTFDRTATTRKLQDVTWVDSRQEREDFTQLAAAKARLDRGDIRRIYQYYDEEQLEKEEESCGCVVQ